MTDPYQVLGVSPSASDDEVKRAYRELSRKYHPDTYADNPLSDLAEEKFKEVQEAYRQVMDMRAGNGYQQGTQGYGSGQNYGGNQAYGGSSGQGYGQNGNPNRQQYQYYGTGYGRNPYGRNGVGGGCTGNLCCDLFLADTCCECMGGDLCGCI